MGIFAISWVFWNWKTIYFLAFNEGLPDERITKVINLLSRTPKIGPEAKL
jgi:hypothetical protein